MRHHATLRCCLVGKGLDRQLAFEQPLQSQSQRKLLLSVRSANAISAVLCVTGRSSSRIRREWSLLHPRTSDVAADLRIRHLKASSGIATKIRICLGICLHLLSQARIHTGAGSQFS